MAVKGKRRSTAGKSSKRKPSTRQPSKRATQRRWSGRVTHESDALDLENAIFTSRSPRRIALSLKHSAEVSRRRKASPYQSAMSMLNFYINRGGKNLSASRKAILERAKPALREAFGRRPARP